MEEKKSSKKKVIIIVIAVIILIILALVLIFRSSSEDGEKTASIATIWLADKSRTGDGQLDWDDASEFVARERIGFIRGKTDGAGSVKIRENLLSEANQNNDITRELADMINSEDILMVVGASTDIATMYAAMETDFFGIPMLVPFSDGDIISSRSADYTLRMTPNSDNYTDYIGRELLPAGIMDMINEALFSDGPLPGDAIDAAVFFADNFNGHDLAVKVTQRLMDNGIDIDHYDTFPEDKLYSAFETVWNSREESFKDVDLVFIIGYDQDPMYDLSRVTEMWSDKDPGDQPLFILMAYSPNSADPGIFKKNNVYVIRQKLDLSTCPADILDHDEAIAYAAGWITGTAIERASARQKPEKTDWRYWLTTEDQRRQSHQDYLVSYRNNIRSVLMEMTDNVPCYGVPSFFNNTGAQTPVELVRYTSVQHVEKLDETAVMNYLYQKFRNRYGITGW